MTKLKSRRIFQGDKTIWVVFFFLCIISLIEVFSSGSRLTYISGSFWDPLCKQALFLSLGTLVVIGVHNIPCRFFKILPFLLQVFSIIFLILALFCGTKINDAGRWVELLGLRFQPSEIAKGAVVMTVALILSYSQREKDADPQAFKLCLVFSIPICLLIFAENISTALMLFGVVIVMMFIGRIPMVIMGKFIGVLTVLGVSAFFLLLSLPDDPNASVYKYPGFGRVRTAKSRVEKFMTHKDKVSPKDYDMDKDAQVGHAHIAIASSNGIGLLPGNSVERDYLSHADSDFIYAIIIEEMGLWGAFFVIFLYIVLLIRAGRIANRCERNFPAFLAMGLALLMVSQAVLNMLVAVGIFPVTGQPLPLISNGGTSTLINCAYIGMILSVSRYARKVEQPATAEGEDKDIVQEFYNDKNLV